MPTDEQVREAQRTTWAGLSAAWEKRDAVITDQLSPVGTAMAQSLGPVGGRHLDIASGTGEPGLSIAREAPSSRVVLTDLSAEMLQVAGRRAHALGVTNVDAVACSADGLPFPDGAFGTVSVRFGYMFFPDLAAATAELVRVLEPGGRLCASVWVRPEDNPWTALVQQAVAGEVELPPPAPDGPHMFRCGAPGTVSRLYEQAGLADVREWDVGVQLVTRSAQEYWEVMSEHVSLAGAALRGVDAATRDRVRAQVVAAAGAYEQDGEVRVPGMARCVVGTKPVAAGRSAGSG